MLPLSKMQQHRMGKPNLGSGDHGDVGNGMFGNALVLDTFH